ncbi:hypothetical protein C2G38_2205336 [Gigaspora rosea]|uniref:Uncharacterized protein n=1 Tax=Gigaspora rosea TaxID=44941 RepID=A0A397UNI4_9GLOM|nr:hypothetical protein C2G38_2205336 [Gigaspora rosea]
MNLEELIFLEKGETQDNKKKKLVIKFTTLIGLFRIFSDTYDNYYLPSSVAERSVIQYIEENLEIEHPLRKKIEIFLEYFDSSKYQNEQFWQYMNYENPKGKEFINKLVQEHIDLQDQIPKSRIAQYNFFDYRLYEQRALSVEELLNRIYNHKEEYELARARYIQDREKEEALLALEGARNIQENDQATPIIFPNTGLTQAT